MKLLFGMWLVLLVASAVEIAPVAFIKDIQRGTFFLPLSRITGGVEAEAHSFPYQVAMRIRTEDDESVLCGGSVISDRFVLTAAHCVDGIKLITVYFGAHQIRLAEEEGRIEQTLNRSNTIIHDKWNSRRIENDIALLRLDNPVTFTDKISPVKLPGKGDASNTYAKEFGTASGWGVFSDKAPVISTILRYTNVTIIGQAECSRSLGPIVRTSNICTLGIQGESTCNGDSGGPLVAYDNSGTKVLVGITSFGSAFGCEINLPAAFTRISSYLDWIAKHTGIELQE